MDISNSTKKEQSTFGIILWIVLISYFLILLNNSLVFASTVQIRRELGMNGVMLSWVSNAYALTFGGFLSLGARLGDIFGRRLALLSGLAIFGLASLLVALSPSAGILIAMRALQGIGGALLAPSTLALLMDTYEGQQRTRAITYYGATAGIGSSLGLIIGGIISSYSSWRLGFLLDADVALVLYAMSVKNVAAGKGQKDQAIDWWGTVTSVIGFSGLVYSINATAYRAGAIIVTIVSLAAFIMIESKTANPLMPLEIFKDNQRSSALVARFFMLGASMAYFFMMPQALQNVFGMSALQAAIAFLPLTVVQFIISLFVARLTFRFSNTAVLIAGAVIDAAGLAMGAVIGIEEGYLLGVALPMVFIGLGQGLIMSPLTVAGVAGTRGDIAGAASGAVNTFHQIGGAVGLAIISALVAGAASPQATIDRAQWGMVALAVITLLAGLNILRGKHE